MARAEPPPADFGPWLARRMEEYGYYSDIALADTIGVGDTTIGRWRGNRVKPAVPELRRLAEALQVPVVEMLVRTGHVTAEELDTADDEVTEYKPIDPAMRRIVQSELDDETQAYLIDLLRMYRRREWGYVDELVRLLQDDRVTDVLTTWARGVQAFAYRLPLSLLPLAGSEERQDELIRAFMKGEFDK